MYFTPPSSFDHPHSTMLEKSSKRDISLNQVEKLCKFYSEHYEVSPQFNAHGPRMASVPTTRWHYLSLRLCLQADANLKKNEENQLVIPIQFKRSSRLLNKSNRFL